MTGIDLIANERRRQIEEEGYTDDRDDWRTRGELGLAGACYALTDDIAIPGHLTLRKLLWPLQLDEIKPSPGNRIRELEKAGALIAAEIDRLLRVQGNE